MGSVAASAAAEFAARATANDRGNAHFFNFASPSIRFPYRRHVDGPLAVFEGRSPEGFATKCPRFLCPCPTLDRVPVSLPVPLRLCSSCPPSLDRKSVV